VRGRCKSDFCWTEGGRKPVAYLLEMGLSGCEVAETDLHEGVGEDVDGLWHATRRSRAWARGLERCSVRVLGVLKVGSRTIEVRIGHSERDRILDLIFSPVFSLQAIPIPEASHMVSNSFLVNLISHKTFQVVLITDSPPHSSELFASAYWAEEET
jgi:hypothetical protein